MQYLDRCGVEPLLLVVLVADKLLELFNVVLREKHRRYQDESTNHYQHNYINIADSQQNLNEHVEPVSGASRTREAWPSARD